MDAAQHIVRLKPIGVELIDRTMIELARADRDVPPDAGAIRARRSGCDPAGRIRRGRSGRESAPPETARRTDGRSRLCLDNSRREAGRRGRDSRSRLAGCDHRGAHLRPQHHDVDEGGGQARLLRRGLRGAARASRRIHVAAHRGVREARHPRHLVRACGRRLPACAPGAQPAARQGRQGDARDRRGRVRDGARLQGLAFRRARRRHRALRISRIHVRQQAGARVRTGEGALRSERTVQSGQDRARAEIRRPRATSASSPAIAARPSRPSSTGRPGPAPAAVSRARSRCATTTAPAARSRAA